MFAINEEEFNLTDGVIEEISLNNDNDILIATVVGSHLDRWQYAFYVYRNEERIHMQWYSVCQTLRYDTKGKSGIYRVLSFWLSTDGKKTTKYSKPIFLNPRMLTYSSANKLRPEDRALQLDGPHWKFPALYFSSEHQRIFVMTSAAVDRNQITLPSFNRWTWAGAGKFPGHVFCVADPTLELQDDMKLGWYLGTHKHDAIAELCSFIRRFAETLGVPENKIVFWGSSGGGFAALALASRIAGSTAVAINAQTNVLAYHIAKSVKTVRDRCFDGCSADDIQEKFGYRVNMSQAWGSNRYSRAILVQNKLDTHHYDFHFRPFWTALGGNPDGCRTADGRSFAWLYEDTRGHVPESVQMIPEILRLIDDNTTASAMIIANGETPAK